MQTHRIRAGDIERHVGELLQMREQIVHARHAKSEAELKEQRLIEQTEAYFARRRQMGVGNSKSRTIDDDDTLTLNVKRFLHYFSLFVGITIIIGCYVRISNCWHYKCDAVSDFHNVITLVNQLYNYVTR